jgi:tight adherence protein B
MSWLVICAVILTLSSILAGVYFTFFNQQDKVKARLSEVFATDQQAQANLRLLEQQHHILKKRRKNQSAWIQKLDTDLERANLLVKPQEFVILCVACAFIGGAILYVMGKGPILALVAAIVGYILPQLLLKVKIMLRMSTAQKQFSDVLDTMVTCFKSGYGFTKAIQTVADNFEDPWSTELRKVSTEMNFGSTLDDALMALSKRVPNADVALFVTAVLIQKETGGNLAELLQTLSKTIRERYKLYSKVQALSAQGKLSAGIIFCIPFGLGGAFALIVPDMMKAFLNNPIGIGLIIFAIILQLIGGVILKKIVTLEV